MSLLLFFISLYNVLKKKKLDVITRAQISFLIMNQASYSKFFGSTTLFGFYRSRTIVGRPLLVFFKGQYLRLQKTQSSTTKSQHARSSQTKCSTQNPMVP